MAKQHDSLLFNKVDGNMIRVDGITGEISLLVDDAELALHHPEQPDLSASHVGMRRELFTALRENITGAEQGASAILYL